MANEPTASDHIAARVRMLLTARDMTVADLAARCAAGGMPKLTAQALYKLMGQRNVPGRPPRPVTVDELLVLARALDVTPGDLYPELAGAADSPVLNVAGEMPAEAVKAYLLGAFRMIERWQNEGKPRFDQDVERSKETIFVDPVTEQVTVMREESGDGSH